MEHEESFDVENLVCTPTDSGVPLPLLLPSQMNNTDLAQSAAAVKLRQDFFELPDFTSAPTDVELLVDYLGPATRHMPLQSSWQARTRDAVVNADLPSMDPWELPGIAGNNGKRDKYYLTDHLQLKCFTNSLDEIRTPNGYWKANMGSAIFEGDYELVGAKKIIKFHPNTGDGGNWIMHAYYFCSGRFVQDGSLVLCHVFQADSTDYNVSRECPTLGSHPGVCNGNHCGQAFGAPSNTLFTLNSTHYDPIFPPELIMHPERHYDPMLLNSYIAQLENLLLGDPDPDNSADAGNCSARTGVPPIVDHGQSKKRKKSSDVWDYFTKIYARDKNGKVWIFAGCNHCCKILTGNSSGGTTHLARHRCPCKFKPVETGRNDKASGGDVNVGGDGGAARVEGVVAGAGARRGCVLGHEP